MYLILFFSLLLIGCSKSSKEKILETEQLILTLEAEFEGKISKGDFPKEFKYLEITPRYHDKRIIPYLEWAFTEGNKYSQKLALLSLSKINDIEAKSIIKSGFEDETGELRGYIGGLLTKINTSTSFFESLPIVDTLGFKKEPYQHNYNYSSVENLKFQLIDSDSSNNSVFTSSVAPTAYFFDSLPNTPTNQNFWFDIGSTFHSGVDNSWARQGEKVVSSANGKVRLIWFDPSWGVMVAVETKHPIHGWLTFIYGHLDYHIAVEPGQYLKSGDLIGFVGTGMTATNGGYPSHLHFGIERCKFENCSLAGYDVNREKWLNPFKLIKETRK
ncbi:M23 family metallopeptidase [bacterium]|nr:M23 family metallopeptidase [bacterium]